MGLALVFGRFQGIHNGHLELFRKLANSSMHQKILWVSPKHDKKNNVLPYADRIRLLHLILPDSICFAPAVASSPYALCEMFMQSDNQNMEIYCGEDRFNNYLKMSIRLENSFMSCINPIAIPRCKPNESGTYIREYARQGDWHSYAEATSRLPNVAQEIQWQILCRHLQIKRV